MSWIVAALVTLWIGVSLYAVFGGADFGGGFWDLVAGGAEKGAAQRARIEKSIGPVWEANHVWLIFSLVITWTCFPAAFAAVASTLYVPCMITAFGVILRGSGFAFRKEVSTVAKARLFGISFALSSVITPFALGTIAGGIASGRVPPGIDHGNVITSWVNPISIIAGLIAVSVCAYLAAVLLCADCSRDGEYELSEKFRRHAVVAAGVVAILGFLSIPVIANDAPRLYNGLTSRGLPVILSSAACAGASVALILSRHFVVARVTSGLAVVTAVWAWAAAQYPDLLPGMLSASQAAAPAITLQTSLIGIGMGAVLVVPSLILLYRLSQRPSPAGGGSG